MTCKGCNTNFCYDCGVKTPHPTGSTCVHARAGVHGEGNNHQVNMYNQPAHQHYGEGNNNQMNVYNRPVLNNNEERNRPGRERMNVYINMYNQPGPNYDQARNGRQDDCVTAKKFCCHATGICLWCLKLSEYT